MSTTLPYPPASTKTSTEEQLADRMASFYHDPLGFVLFAYPWGEPGPLEHFDGPDEDQRAFLEDLAKEVRDRRFDGRNAVMATRMAVSSGHGTGKSARAAWIVDWLMSTRPGAQGTVTANTNGQLATKTWAAIQHWTKLCITAHWFEMTSERMWRTGKKESWFCTPQSCREENSEAFAGQHALTSTSFYIFDEGSAVPDSIYEVAEGGLTDGEPMIFIFGNPTRNTGKLYRTVFGSERNRWVHRVIDARKSKFPNKAQIAEWIEDHGEDSDFVRVRVRGLPPQASDLQFIDSERVFGAQQREPSLLGDEPLIAGVDIARGGADNNVIRFRRGQDARSIKPIRIPGEENNAVRHRVGLTSREAYYGSLGRQIQTLQGRAGRLELSAADTSTLTWFDTSQFYRRPENSFSYYNKGLLIGLLLDLEIRNATDNTYSMDDVLRYLNVEYAQKGRFFDDDYGVARAITAVTGLDLDDMYTDFVHRPVELPYAEHLAYAGLELLDLGGGEFEVRELPQATEKQLRIRASWLGGD